jgi:hypothetical protein
MNNQQPNSAQPAGDFCRRTRREFLWESGAGFTGLAMTGLLTADKFFAGHAAMHAYWQPLVPKQ